MLSTIICLLSVGWMIVIFIGFVFFSFFGIGAYYWFKSFEPKEPNKAEERLRDKLRAEKGGDHV